MPNIQDTNSRLAHLETQIGSLATQFKTFIDESKESRERNEREVTKLWEAVVKQGEQLRSSLDAVSSKGQITWQMIFAAVTVIITVIAFAGGVVTSIIDGKIDRVRDGVFENKSDIKYAYERTEADSLSRHNDQQAFLLRLEQGSDNLKDHIVKDSYNQGWVDAELECLKWMLKK